MNKYLLKIFVELQAETGFRKRLIQLVFSMQHMTFKSQNIIIIIAFDLFSLKLSSVTDNIHIFTSSVEKISKNLSSNVYWTQKLWIFNSSSDASNQIVASLLKKNLFLLCLLKHFCAKVQRWFNERMYS